MKKTFILIHGSWHSAWNWHKIIPIMESMGHRVIAPDLPGMGRDKTPIAEVKMNTTVEKICRLIDDAGEKVVLVGHSKNGIMISQAAEYRPQQVEKLVYLAAYLVPDGKTQKEYSMQDTAGVLKPFVRMNESMSAHTLDPAIYKEGLYHDCEDYISQLARLLLSQEPVESGITPLHLTEANYGSVPRYYIECTEDRAVTPFIQKKMYTEMPCKKVYSMQSSHSPFFSQPEKLSEILLEIANSN